VSDGVETLTVAARRLDEAGVRLEDLALRRPSLDDVFLALTGHRAGNGDSQGEAEVKEQ
jgi:ABC-2 type transport system ATP-binding protein